MILGWRLALAPLYGICLTSHSTSAFVGMAVMITLFPAPGYLAKLMQTVHAQKMKLASREFPTFMKN
jgi:hypothetical protein